MLDAASFAHADGQARQADAIETSLGQPVGMQCHD